MSRLGYPNPKLVSIGPDPLKLIGSVVRIDTRRSTNVEVVPAVVREKGVN